MRPAMVEDVPVTSLADRYFAKAQRLCIARKEWSLIGGRPFS